MVLQKMQEKEIQKYYSRFSIITIAWTDWAYIHYLLLLLVVFWVDTLTDDETETL